MESTSEYVFFNINWLLPLLQMCRMHYECDRPSLFVASRFKASSAPPFPAHFACTTSISIINSVIIVTMFTFEDMLASDHSVLIAIASIINLNIIVKGRHHQKKKIFWALPERGGRGNNPKVLILFTKNQHNFHFYKDYHHLYLVLQYALVEVC